MKKIMLVDDKEMSNFIMRKFLEMNAPDCEIYDFTDPEGAYHKIDSINPDLIFLDLNMPIMDGWDFLQQMADEKKANKVAIVTSSTSENDKNESLNYNNIVQFIIKPFAAEELVNVIDRV
ncbi:MAG: response regulator [Owenweeksia sp.]